MKIYLIFPMTFLSLCSAAESGPLVWDGLVSSMHQVHKDLGLGQDRMEVHDLLEEAIKNHPNSPHSDIAKTLSADLFASAQRISEASAQRVSGAPGAENSIHENSMRLMDTKMPFALLSYSPNWKPALEEYIAENPSDPVVKLLLQGRSAIEVLLTHLEDASPTREKLPYEEAIGMPRIPRVNDMALVAIEYLSKARFLSTEDSRKRFHRLSDNKRAQVIRQISKWWTENKDKAISDGIHAQLPHVDVFARIAMAENLATSIGTDPKKSDRQDAIEILKTIVQQSSGSAAAIAAKTLAKLGDFSSVDVFYADLARQSSPPRYLDHQIVFYLTEHGNRREWELLHRFAEQEIELGLKLGSGIIWPLAVRSRQAETSPLAIPILGLALAQTEKTGSRHVPGVGSQSFSLADTAIENLQNITKIDFGYRIEASEEERTIAIKEAQEWWRNQGRQKYTFDYVETLAASGKSRQF